MRERAKKCTETSRRSGAHLKQPSRRVQNRAGRYVMNFLCTWVINKCNGYEARQMSLSRGFVTSRGKNVNCDQALCFFFFLEKKCRRTPYSESKGRRTRDRTGGYLYLGSWSCSVAILDLTEQNVHSMASVYFFTLLTNGMNVVPARKNPQNYGPGKCFKFERKINDHEIARDSAETISHRR